MIRKWHNNLTMPTTIIPLKLFLFRSRFKIVKCKQTTTKKQKNKKPTMLILFELILQTDVDKLKRFAQNLIVQKTSV